MLRSSEVIDRWEDGFGDEALAQPAPFRGVPQPT